MYDMYTPLSSTDYKFTYEEALKKAADTLTILEKITARKWTKPSQSAGLMSMKMRANAQALIQAEPMIPMPSSGTRRRAPRRARPRRPGPAHLA